ncbi:1,3-beta-glucanosyltransferase [Homalodisca vitripennis]|nr:1,3-beta-glucanosyltransferase [Homalodisca vitripennis]
MADTPGCMPRWRSGPTLGDWGHHTPETEEEYVEYYQDRITLSQSRQLLPLTEDLADWLNKTLGEVPP